MLLPPHDVSQHTARYKMLVVGEQMHVLKIPVLWSGKLSVVARLSLLVSKTCELKIWRGWGRTAHSDPSLPRDV